MFLKILDNYVVGMNDIKRIQLDYYRNLFQFYICSVFAHEDIIFF